MKENRNNEKFVEDEIDLKDLIMTLWNSKKIIIASTLVIALLAGSISMFALTPVYDTKLSLVVSMPEEYNTRYGKYQLPITTNNQYVDLIYSNDVLSNTIRDMNYNIKDISIEVLKKKISIEKMPINSDIEQNSFEVIVSSDNPAESLKLAQTLYSNYIEFVDVMTKERAINYFYNDFNVQIRSLENGLNSTKELLENNKNLLANTPKTIESSSGNIEIQSQLTGNSNYVVPINSINPNYIKIENDIIGNMQSISNIENSIRMNKKYLDELDKEKLALTKYYETGQAEKLETSVIGVVETSVYLPSPPVAPTQKTSPSNLINTAIGIAAGFVIGVIISLVKGYWFKENEK